MTTEQYRTRSGLSIFLSFFRPHRGLFFLDLACALVVALIDLAYPIVSRYAMRTLLPQNAYRAFFTVMLVVVAAYALRALLYFVITYWGHTFGIRVEADIRAALFGHMQELGFEFFDRNRTGQLMSRMTTDLFEITELAHHGPEDLFISFVTIVGALAVMATIEWRLTLVVAVMIPVFILVSFSRRKAMRTASRRVKKKTAVINADIESALSGIRTAKAFANEPVEAEKFTRSNDTYKTSKKQFHKEMGIFMGTMEFFTTSLSVAVVAVGGLLIMQGQMDTVDLLTFTLYIASFVTPIRKLANFSELYANGTAGFERFLEIMRTEPELRDAPDAVDLGRPRGEIGVNDVSFSYEGDLAVLHDVSLQIPAGQTVAIVGPSGGGKSTLCQLIPRFYDVSSGSITIDGQSVWENAALKARIAAIPDDWYYFSTASIRDMTRFYRGFYPRFSMERYEKLRDIFRLDEKRPIRRLSKGMQKQAAFWLSLSAMPDCLILDEPVDGLDPVMRRQVWSLVMGDVSERGTTVLVSSHNLRELEDVCDHVGILDHGKVLLERSLAQLQDNMVKLQVVFPDGMTEVPAEIPVLHASKIGRIHTLILRMNADEATALLAQYQPLLVDAVPLTLEEIFIYELGGADYAVKDIVL